jgi:hypothetical protein
MAKVLAGITTSVDGYITGPDDGPGKGLGEDQREAWMPQPAGVPRSLLWCLKSSRPVSCSRREPSTDRSFGRSTGTQRC